MEQLEEQCELLQNEIGPMKGLFLKSLFGITSEQVMMLDPLGKILFTNKGIFGRSSKEVIGKTVYNVVPSSYALILKNQITEVNKTRAKVYFDSIIEVKNVQKKLEIVIAPVYDDNAMLLGYSLASMDITEVKKAQRQFNYKSNLEKLFLTISTKFINLSSDHIDEGVNESLELISRFTNSEHAYIILFDDEQANKGYEWHASYMGNGPFCSLNAVHLLLNRSIKKLNYTEPVLIKPADTRFNINNDCPILVNPMLLRGKHYGVLVLVGNANSDSDWSADFAEPMMLFSNVFINTMERKKNSLLKKQRELNLEKAIRERTIAIEQQKDKLIDQANELAKTEGLLRESNDKLKQLNQGLEETVSHRTSSLQKTNQELDRFVYSVSHDIKAPLASVKGLINLVRLSPKDELENSLQLMEKSIDKLNGFVEDILMHSRNSRVQLNCDIIDFKKEIELAVEGLRHMDYACDIKLITIFKEDAVGITDQYRLQSILKNLISNAVKYHNPEAKKSWVKVVVEVNKQRILINITDNGIGIGAAYLDKIFDMFYRASENSFGSGLGLYIVKETAEKIGGNITVASQEKVGTTFSLNIPNRV